MSLFVFTGLLLCLTNSVVYAGKKAVSKKQRLHIQKKNHDCAKCHQLSKDEALKVLKEDMTIPDVKVIEVRPGPVKGFWEVAFEAESRKVIGYLDFSKQHIIFGNLLNIKTRANLTGERLQDINRVDVSGIPLDDALVMGDKDAKHKIIVFDDPD
ncbi:MAG: hypothetical protein HY754_00450 [Nitrospirae bacterium]|nr:hypothetical protein [Nitrospirota bacterium]